MLCTNLNYFEMDKRHYICNLVQRIFHYVPSLVSIQLKLEKKVHEELKKSEIKQSICRDDYFILHGPILYLFLPPF